MVDPTSDSFKHILCNFIDGYCDFESDGVPLFQTVAILVEACKSVCEHIGVEGPTWNRGTAKNQFHKKLSDLPTRRKRYDPCALLRVQLCGGFYSIVLLMEFVRAGRGRVGKGGVVGGLEGLGRQGKGWGGEEGLGEEG